MWMRSYTNQSSSKTTATSADNTNNGCGAIDQYGNPMSMIMPPLPAADHSFNGRRLHPLIPKPSTCTANNPTLPSCFNRGSCDTNNNDFFPLNHHITTSQSHHHLMGIVGQGGRRDTQFNGNQSLVVSSRWNPTPEQLRALEELYGRGTRTPSAVQIQHITSQLRRYGKIEGKNVFYWFQNHKARERQKRRRQQLENSSSPNDQQQSLGHHDDHQTKEPAPGDESNHSNNKGSTTGFEIEQTKAWAASINCSTLADQESVNKTEKAAAKCVTDDEWVQFQDHDNSLQIASVPMFQDSVEEQHRRRTSLSLLAKKNTTWDNTQHHSTPSTSFIKPTSMTNEACEYQDDQCNNKDQEALTLELFPLRSNNVAMMKDDDGDGDSEDKGTPLTSYQFFEFLPLKNNTAY